MALSPLLLYTRYLFTATQYTYPLRTWEGWVLSITAYGEETLVKAKPQRQTSEDQPDISRPGLVKSSITNFKIRTVNLSLLHEEC